MLELIDVSFSYGDGWALKNINLKIEENSFVLVVGANGSGKTTLFKLLAGLLPLQSGFIRLNGKDLKEIDLKKICCYVFHNPFDQIIGSTVEEDIAFGLENLGLSRDQIRARVQKTLESFQLDERRHDDPFTLSGGTAQKLAVASLYALQPEIFLLDEPTSMLDDEGVYEILKALEELKKMGKTILISTHEPKIFFNLATQIIHMRRGSVDFFGSLEDFLEERFEDVEC
ncbi:energy-coupling factor ABC transporter ATP-binding protein [Pseudothermotoga sp.]|nr:energy-coupling factor ABC transporter ATP-binding protein [Pseudothermotoga sp.]MDW8139867.1 ABC transporter ATP-binding protein [Pseudothermotoga sp.]